MPKPVHIYWVLNGWKVSVGCQEVVFDNRDILLTALRGYLFDPEATEKRWLERSINARWTGDGVQHAQGQTPPLRMATQEEMIGRRIEDVPQRADPDAGRPYLPAPVEQIIERLDNLERDTDTRLDDLSQRLDGIEGASPLALLGEMQVLKGRADAQSHMLERQHSRLTEQANKGDELERALEGDVDDRLMELESALEGDVDDRLMELESAVRGLQADGRESE